MNQVSSSLVFFELKSRSAIISRVNSLPFIFVIHSYFHFNFPCQLILTSKSKKCHIKCQQPPTVSFDTGERSFFPVRFACGFSVNFISQMSSHSCGPGIKRHFNLLNFTIENRTLTIQSVPFWPDSAFGDHSNSLCDFN